MSETLLIALAIPLGIVVGLLVYIIFNKLPESWLQDYGYDPNAPDFRLSKRMKIIPHALIASIFSAAIFVLTVISGYSRYFEVFRPLHLLVIILSTPVIMVVIMSDRLNRIIPDQCWIALLIIGILSAVSDLLEGSLWYFLHDGWYRPLLSRIAAMLIGAGVLFLIEFICETFLGKEGMGQGDMKLLGACGMLVGLEGLLILVYVAVFSALLFAIPLFIRKRIRIANEEKEIRNSANPIKTRQEIRARKANMHFADDPDYLAFGPFLALGAAIFLSMEPIFYEHLIGYIVAIREMIFHA